MLRYLVALAVVILILGISLNFLLPRFLGDAVNREKIIALIAEKVPGTFDIRDAEMVWFPLPRLIVHQARLTIPGKFEGTVETIRVFLKVVPLLKGDVKLSRLQLIKPVVTVVLPERTEEKTWSLTEIATLLRSASLGSHEIIITVDDALVALVKSRQAMVILKGFDMQADMINNSDGVKIILDELRSAEPKLRLGGIFRVEPSSRLIALDLKGKGIDIPSVRNSALTLAGDVIVLQRIFDILRSGTVGSISFQSMGASPEDLGKTANIKIKGRLDRGGVVISGLDLGFTEVSGDCEITDGILRGSDLKGQIMHSRISNGKLSIGLHGNDALFMADAAVSADLADVHTILSRIVRDPEFHRELGHVQAIRGRAEGRLLLGNSLAAVRPKADIAKMKFAAEYDRIPLPVAVEQGSFSYDAKGVAVKNLAGNIGNSRFSGLSARITTGNSPYLEVLAGRMNVETGEVHRWLSLYEKLKEPLRKLASVSGRFNLSSLTFQGMVMDSKDWNFRASGSTEQLVINTPLLPGPLALNSGKFETQPGQLVFFDVATKFLDASPVISGSLNTSLENVRRGDIRFSGTIGPKALQWIKSAFSIPEYIRTDQPISASAARLSWQERGDMAFQGALKPGSGQSVVIELAKGRDHFTISRLDVTDVVSKASFTIDLQEKKRELSFKGRLDTSTAAWLITTPQMSGGVLQGDFTAVFSRGERSDIIAQGRLGGEKIVLPWKKEMPLIVDSVALTADKGRLEIDSARMRLGANAFSVKGNIASNAGGILVDMDISSDRILWDDVVKPDGEGMGKEGPSGEKKKPLNVHGLVRVKAGLLDYQGFQFSPFHADIALSSEKMLIRSEKSRVCGVGMTGDISLYSVEAGSEIGMDLRFDATDQELKPTVLCLSKGRSDATGRFTLKGRLKGRGKAGDLKRIIEGKIELTAKKGTVYRYKTLDTVFDFLNKGEELGGQMPDLDKSELAYELLKVEASVGKGSLIVEEAIIDSTVLGVVAQGSLNLVENQLDLNVMVAPLRQVNKIVRYIPLVGDVVSGSLISVPVKVTGTPVDPQVTYLSPSAAASNLSNMMKRTLNLPVRILSPLFPKKKQD